MHGARGRMSSAAAIAAMFIATVLSWAGESGTASAPASPSPDQSTAPHDYGALPLTFESNRGQTDPQAQFLARTRSFDLFLTPSAAVFSLAGVGADKPASALRMNVLGAAAPLRMAGTVPARGIANYLASTSPGAATSIPTFATVESTDVYPGVDLTYSGAGNELEYDFIVHPGADPGAIRLGFEGAQSLRLDEHGDLVVDTPSGNLLQHKPVLYQEFAGARHIIAGEFVLTGQQVSFSVGAYNPGRTLVIDPTIAYSTYLGGGDQDLPSQVVVDGQGNAYVAGMTRSLNFPTTVGALKTSNPLQSVFVTKLNPTGSALIYSTFIASTQLSSIGTGIALAADGSVWVTSTNTGPADVPVTPGAFLTTRPGDSAAFLVRLSANGSQVLYGTYIAIPGNDGLTDSGAGAIALGSDGDPWIAPNIGYPLASPAFPTTAGAVQSTCKPFPDFADFCTQDVLVIKLHPGSAGLADLAYASYLGGSGDESSMSLQVDATGAVYVFGGTDSPDFPTTPGALMTEQPGGQDLFVSKLRPAGNGASDLLYSTYFGGDRQEGTGDMAVGADGSAYVTFATQSFNIPTTPGAFQQFRSDLSDGVIARINPVGAGAADLLYSTYLGSGGNDASLGIALDGRGRVFVTGAGGVDFPIRNPLACCAANRGPQEGSTVGDATLTMLNPAGQGDADLVFSTFLGGTGIDSGKDIVLALDVNRTARAAYVVGRTQSSDFPISASAFQPNLAGGDNDGFVTKVDLTDLIPCTRTLTGNVLGPVVVGTGEVVCITAASVSGSIVVQPGGEVRIQNSRIAGDVTSNGAAAFSLCGATVSRSVMVSGTSSAFVLTTGEGCAPNQIFGSSNVPGGGTGSTTSSTSSTTTSSTTSLPTTTSLAPTTTTVPPTTTTLPPTTTTTPPYATEACLLLARQLETTTDPAIRQAIQAARARYGCTA